MQETTTQTNGTAVNIAKKELPDLGVNSVILNLRINSLGRTKKVRVNKKDALGFESDIQGAVLTDADTDLIKAGKELLESSEVKAIKRCDNAMRSNLRIMSLPANKALRGGFMRIPLNLVPDVNTLLQNYIVKRLELIQVLVDNRAAIIERDRERLASLFQIEDYPDEDSLREAYTVSYQFMQFSVPETLMKAGVYEQERSKAQEQMQVIIDECRTALRSELSQMVKHAAAKLTIKPGEEPKVFRNSLIGNIEDFLQFFEARDITNDAALASVVKEVRDVMRGVDDPEKLRTDMQFREEIAKSFTAIEKAMDKNVVVKPKRKIRLADDDES